MQRLEVSGAVRLIYLYVWVVRRQRVNLTNFNKQKTVNIKEKVV